MTPGSGVPNEILLGDRRPVRCAGYGTVTVVSLSFLGSDNRDREKTSDVRSPENLRLFGAVLTGQFYPGPEGGRDKPSP